MITLKDDQIKIAQYIKKTREKTVRKVLKQIPHYEFTSEQIENRADEIKEYFKPTTIYSYNEILSFIAQYPLSHDDCDEVLSCFDNANWMSSSDLTFLFACDLSPRTATHFIFKKLMSIYLKNKGKNNAIEILIKKSLLDNSQCTHQIGFSYNFSVFLDNFNTTRQFDSGQYEYINKIFELLVIKLHKSQLDWTYKEFANWIQDYQYPKRYDRSGKTEYKNKSRHVLNPLKHIIDTWFNAESLAEDFCNQMISFYTLAAAQEEIDVLIRTRYNNVSENLNDAHACYAEEFKECCMARGFDPDNINEFIIAQKFIEEITTNESQSNFS